MRAVRRALLLLQLMARSERRASALEDLSRLAGLPKSTTHRLLETMIASGFVEHGVNARRSRFRHHLGFGAVAAARRP